MITTLRFALTILVIHFCVAASAQLSGNYTINSALPTGGTNFQTFTAFADTINLHGVSGAVYVDVTPGSGPYNEQVTFNNIPGTGPGADILLNGNNETITGLTTTTNRHIIRLQDEQYFSINNLNISWNPASSGGFYGIHIYNSGNHITIGSCNVDMTGTNSTLYGGYVASGSLTSILDSGNFHNISFLGNTTTGGGYGVSVYGKVLDLATGINIIDNTFNDFHSNGVYLRETNGADISQNHFDKSTANITSDNAIQIAQNANINASIHENYIKVSQTNNGTVTFRGIYLFNGIGHKVYNNQIYDVHLTSGNFTGIEVRTAGTAPEIYFNTISIDNASATTGNLYGIKEELSNTNSVLRNNLISISQTTSGMKAGLVLGATATVTTAFNSDYNLIWVPGGNTALKNPTTPVLYPTLANWQAASTQDANSISLDPLFVSAILPIPTNVLADNEGITIPSITTDITGMSRGVIPDIGAYEFAGITGIESRDAAHSLLCYPNPFSNLLNVALNNNKSSELILYNAISGKQILHSFTNAVSLDTKELPCGIYFYEVRSGNERVGQGKIIKQ